MPDARVSVVKPPPRKRGYPKGMPPSPQRIAAQIANGRKGTSNHATADEAELIRSLKRYVRREAFPELARKCVAVICDRDRTFGDPAFNAAADFAADRCSWPRMSQAQVETADGTGPVLRFEFVGFPRPGTGALDPQEMQIIASVAPALMRQPNEVPS